jgi:3-oxoacyl-[acyl-carrier-protein] synthase III
MTNILPFRRPESTDALYDTSNEAMAERFGMRTRQLLHDGRDVASVARIAASYADRVLRSQMAPDEIDLALLDLGFVPVGGFGAVQ